MKKQKDPKSPYRSVTLLPPKAIDILEKVLEDRLYIYTVTALDARKISSTKPMELLNREIRRRTKSIEIFPNL